MKELTAEEMQDERLKDGIHLSVSAVRWSMGKGKVWLKVSVRADGKERMQDSEPVWVEEGSSISIPMSLSHTR